jgi:dTDP-4-dehydrorhamnose 3,5-epimerase
MKITHLKIEGLIQLEAKILRDDRGFFVERFNHAKFEELGLNTKYFQDNHSRSFPKVLRGLHFQNNPGQGKLIGVVRGKIWDVAVDLRKESPTFGQHYAAELSDENGALLWIPKGFAHGFCVLGDEPADVLYKVDAPFSPTGDGGVKWDDPELKIPWPIENPIISKKDELLPELKNLKNFPLV